MKTKEKKFPNGFQSWQEAHFEVVTHIQETVDIEGSVAEKRRTHQGTGGLYELAEEMTNLFENLNKGRLWDGEFYDEIDLFLQKNC